MIKNNGWCDLEYAIELRDLGVPQDSLWWWIESKDTKGHIYLAQGCYRERDLVEYEMTKGFRPQQYSAFTLAELRERLPKQLIPTIDGDTEANCNAKMLIWLKKNVYEEEEDL